MLPACHLALAMEWPALAHLEGLQIRGSRRSRPKRPCLRHLNCSGRRDRPQRGEDRLWIRLALRTGTSCLRR